MTGTSRRGPYRTIAGTLIAAVLATGVAAAQAQEQAQSWQQHEVQDAAGAGNRARFGTHRRPVPGAVLQGADIPEQNWLPGHRGVDLTATPGDAVSASAAGTVHFAGVVAGTPLVSVEHGNGLRTTYEPVIAAVSTGDTLHAGQHIGVLADASTLPATARRGEGLSWGARVEPPDGGSAVRYIDPMSLLGVVRVRLWS
ncbi:M23 family metallopeptidase [Corynebacterium sp. AOP40-9SA-29]|uniref:M23 family metallopeptidase n=1 Tax=Corynebacterium sp. AOP40-9SA-29 TaxID=3457677 RepID=UPI004034E352